MSSINLEHGTSMLDPYAAEDRLQPVSCTSLSSESVTGDHDMMKDDTCPIIMGSYVPRTQVLVYKAWNNRNDGWVFFFALIWEKPEKEIREHMRTKNIKRVGTFFLDELAPLYYEKPTKKWLDTHGPLTSNRRGNTNLEWS